MTQKQNDELMYSSSEDQAFYLKCVDGLPTLAGLNGTGKDAEGVPLPYGVGPHSVRCFREVIEIVKPSIMFEIGFNMGWSAALWLELTNGIVHSCDISTKAETLAAAHILEGRYAGRFSYEHRNKWNSEKINSGYDLIFIDGGHLFEDVTADIKQALDWQIPYLVMDDWMPEFGEVQKAVWPFINFSNALEVININGNIALLKNITL